MIGCYPNGKPADPQTYIAAVVAVLAEYPAEIVAQVCDPVHGLARKLRFLPTIAELAEALEAAMTPLRRQWIEEKGRREQARQREIDARALPDFEAERRIAEGLKKLAGELAAAPDPNPPKMQGNEPVTKPVSNYASRVLAEIAKRKADCATDKPNTEAAG